jgi:hypothetical protein
MYDENSDLLFPIRLFSQFTVFKCAANLRFASKKSRIIVIPWATRPGSNHAGGKNFPEDVVCRYGGEEFVVLMPRSTLSDALCRSETWRSTIQNTSFQFTENPLSNL